VTVGAMNTHASGINSNEHRRVLSREGGPRTGEPASRAVIRL
jgi:hypothetical protein